MEVLSGVRCREQETAVCLKSGVHPCPQEVQLCVFGFEFHGGGGKSIKAKLQLRRWRGSSLEQLNMG